VEGPADVLVGEMGNLELVDPPNFGPLLTRASVVVVGSAVGLPVLLIVVTAVLGGSVVLVLVVVVGFTVGLPVLIVVVTVVFGCSVVVGIFVLLLEVTVVVVVTVVFGGSVVVVLVLDS